MLDQRAYLRIREGAFTYLLPASRAVSIERRNRGKIAVAQEAGPLTVAWSQSESGWIPIVRLGAFLATPSGEWEYAILLSDGTDRIGVAAEHIYLIPEPDVPAIQPFNPVGARTPGGPVVIGLSRDTEPEYLVLDLARLQHALRLAAQRAEA